MRTGLFAVLLEQISGSLKRLIEYSRVDPRGHRSIRVAGNRGSTWTICSSEPALAESLTERSTAARAASAASSEPSVNSRLVTGKPSMRQTSFSTASKVQNLSCYCGGLLTSESERAPPFGFFAGYGIKEPTSRIFQSQGVHPSSRRLPSSSCTQDGPVTLERIRSLSVTNVRTRSV